MLHAAPRTGSPTILLSYHPPLDWPGMLRFLAARLLKGVEWIEDEVYYRTIRFPGHTGWIAVRQLPDEHALLAEPSDSLRPVLPVLTERLRHAFDLNARPDIIARHLMQDARLADLVARSPGVRIPGAFDGFELGVRAVLGQQVTVKAATTVAARFALAFGDPIETPRAELLRVSPAPGRIAAASVDEVASLGIIQARARAIIALAQAIESGQLILEPGLPPEPAIARLAALPGIGPWTTQYLAMRTLGWADAFPRGDVALLKRMGGVTPARAEALAESWRPWRSYATLYLWSSEA
jgi:AraC family transcriptional regulator, regulatory protein of adaptative response / DNA-3-methyladenine glycosylase II